VGLISLCSRAIEKLQQFMIPEEKYMLAEISGTKIRRIILEQSRRANVGHIGSALSVADIVAVLYSGILEISSAEPRAPERDRFIVSKGHASLALYAALCLRGVISEADLNTYCANGSRLGVHPEHRLPGVDFSTGSLGQGLSVGAGAALGARLRGSGQRVFVLMSDAECNEGAVWEAAMFAAHNRILNLIAIVDVNGQQALGYTRDVLSLEPLADKWRSFGWTVHEVDGHNAVEMNGILTRSGKGSAGAPSVILAKTVFGKGVSFMENQIKWHYWPMNEDEYIRALRENGSFS
jgi:transketolase